MSQSDIYKYLDILKKRKHKVKFYKNDSLDRLPFLYPTDVKKLQIAARKLGWDVKHDDDNYNTHMYTFTPIKEGITMKKSELKNIIKEEIKKVLSEAKQYRGKFSVRKGSGNSAKDWKNYIEKIPGVKVKIYPSAYVGHTAVDVIVNNKDTAKKVIKAWRNYGIDWPEVNDFQPISDYSPLI